MLNVHPTARLPHKQLGDELQHNVEALYSSMFTHAVWKLLEAIAVSD